MLLIHNTTKVQYNLCHGKLLNQGRGEQSRKRIIQYSLHKEQYCGNRLCLDVWLYCYEKRVMLEIGYCNKIVHRYGVSVPQDVICNNNSAKRRNISHQSTPQWVTHQIFQIWQNIRHAMPALSHFTWRRQIKWRTWQLTVSAPCSLNRRQAKEKGKKMHLRLFRVGGFLVNLYWTIELGCQNF